MSATSASNPSSNIVNINTSTPNPFSVRPIATQWTTNELILNDPRLRVCAGVSQLDINQTNASKIIVPSAHLEPGYVWKA